MPELIEDVVLAAKIKKFKEDADLFHTFIHGRAGVEIQTENGPVRTVSTILGVNNNNVIQQLTKGVASFGFVGSDSEVTSSVPMYYTSFRIWDEGNTNLGFGCNADQLNGKEGSFYQNADNLNAGTLPAARMTGEYPIDITGTSATASTSSLLGGQNPAYYSNASNINAGSVGAPQIVNYYPGAKVANVDGQSLKLMGMSMIYTNSKPSTYSTLYAIPSVGSGWTNDARTVSKLTSDSAVVTESSGTNTKRFMGNLNISVDSSSDATIPALETTGTNTGKHTIVSPTSKRLIQVFVTVTNPSSQVDSSFILGMFRNNSAGPGGRTCIGAVGLNLGVGTSLSDYSNMHVFNFWDETNYAIGTKLSYCVGIGTENTSTTDSRLIWNRAGDYDANFNGTHQCGFIIWEYEPVSSTSST